MDVIIVVGSGGSVMLEDDPPTIDLVGGDDNGTPLLKHFSMTIVFSTP